MIVGKLKDSTNGCQILELELRRDGVAQPWGFTVMGPEVTHVAPGGIANRYGLSTQHVLFQINGLSVSRMQQKDIVHAVRMKELAVVLRVKAEDTAKAAINRYHSESSLLESAPSSRPHPLVHSVSASGNLRSASPLGVATLTASTPATPAGEFPPAPPPLVASSKPSPAIVAAAAATTPVQSSPLTTAVANALADANATLRPETPDESELRGSPMDRGSRSPPQTPNGRPFTPRKSSIPRLRSTGAMSPRPSVIKRKQ